MKFAKIAAGVALSVLLSIPSAAMAGKEETVFGDWTYAKKFDPLDGGTTHQAFVIDKSNPPGILGIQCDKAGDPTLGSPYVKYIQGGAFFGTKGLYPVKFRVDENQMMEQEWVVRERAIYTTKEFFVTTITGQMKTGASIIIEALDFRYRPHRNTFSLNGAGEAIAAVEEGCKG